MFALGLSGGLDAVHEQKLDTPENYTYDGAAVLVKDGVVVAAIEEERLDRIKHSNKFPSKAIKFCLDREGLRIQDVDLIAYYVDESTADALLARMYLTNPEMPRRIDARSLLRLTLGRELGGDFDPSKLRFYEHKLTHAASVMHHSGFDESLVFVIDNAGGVYHGRRDDDGKVTLKTLAATSPAKSPQKLCYALLPFLGFGIFDEYKALALAPYGDAERYAPLVGAMYQLLLNGDYQLHLTRASALIGAVEPRRAGAEPSDEHKDLAAALQHAMESIALHVLGHHRLTTGLPNLCMAGGMSENVSTNARVLYSGLFDQVFVHPAAYDSGCALGAALLASENGGQPSARARVRGVNWGTDIGVTSVIATQLNHWGKLLQTTRYDDLAWQTAVLLAQGALVAWVQGQSEFGSHALGNRNVLADPRISENRERIHRAFGRAETYRPLAALILEEDARSWCDLPPGTDSLPFQTFAARVHVDKHALLGAAMQMDGCARVQTISRESNLRLWSVIKAFGELTGTPALLTASFNHSVEPTVEFVDDAVATFLTSGLDYLVAGDFIAAKAASLWEERSGLCASLPPYVQVVRAKGLTERRRRAPHDEIRTTYSPQSRRPISRELGDLLIELDDETPLDLLLQRAGLDTDGERRLTSELIELWTQRMLVMRPAQSSEIRA